MGIIMYSTRILTNRHDLETFAELYESKAHYRINLQFVTESNETCVRGFFKDREMIAGFIVNHSRNLRHLRAIPDDVLPTIPFFNEVGLENLCEVSCFWMEKTGVNSWLRLWIYFWTMYDAYRTGKRYVIVGGSVEKMKDLNTIIYPRIFYYGRTTLPGVKMWFYARKRQPSLLFAIQTVRALIRLWYFDFKKPGKRSEKQATAGNKKDQNPSRTT
jgi:hypothetical protein